MVGRFLLVHCHTGSFSGHGPMWISSPAGCTDTRQLGTVINGQHLWHILSFCRLWEQHWHQLTQQNIVIWPIHHESYVAQMLSTAPSTAALVYKNSFSLFSDNTLTVQSCNRLSCCYLLITVLPYFTVLLSACIIYNCYLYVIKLICTDHWTEIIWIKSIQINNDVLVTNY